MVSLVNSMVGDHPARPVLVLSNDPNASGLDKAAKLGVEATCIDHTQYNGDRRAFEIALDEKLRDVQPDIICLAGFMRVLSSAFVEAWQGRILNIHPSLLPKYKGLHTHQRALDAGDKIHGCTVHEVTAELDDGPVLGQASINIESNETVDTLASRLLPLEHILYPKVLKAFAQGDKKTILLNG